MKILFIGDLVGSAGRKLLKAKLSQLKEQYQVDLCIANAENAAAGLGLTISLAREIKNIGVDVLTMGNHTWSKRELLRSIDDIPYLIRPANVPAAWPGQPYLIHKHDEGDVLVVNLIGRIFMEPANDPFSCVDQILETVKKDNAIRMTVVDFHAEATSEKTAMAYFLDGRVSLVAGTHTHVQTADERILSRGTAFITDVGMDPESSLRRMVDRLPAAYSVAEGPAVLSAVWVDVDPLTGQTKQIERIRVDE